MTFGGLRRRVSPAQEMLETVLVVMGVAVLLVNAGLVMLLGARWAWLRRDGRQRRYAPAAVMPQAPGRRQPPLRP